MRIPSLKNLWRPTPLPAASQAAKAATAHALGRDEAALSASAVAGRERAAAPTRLSGSFLQTGAAEESQAHWDRRFGPAYLGRAEPQPPRGPRRACVGARAW